MSAASDFIDLQITINDASPSAPNFGALALFGYSAPGSSGWHTYTANPSGILGYIADAGLATDNAYRMIQTMVAQTPHVSQIKWFNTKSVPTASMRITPLGPFTPGKVYKITIGGVVCSVTADDTSSATEIATALHALANAVPGVGSVDGTGYITVTPDSPYTFVALEGYNPANLSIQENTTHSVGIASILDTALGLDSEFYGVLVDMCDATNIAAAASWVETNRKLALFRTPANDALGGGGILDTLYSAGYHRSGLIFSTDGDSRADAALLARQLALNPGASDFQFKGLAGVTVDQLGAATSTFRAKNGLTYERTLGVPFSTWGTAVSGRPLAVTRNVDWLESRILQFVLSAMVNHEIILIDPNGIAVFEKAISSALQEAEAARVVLPGWKVNAPRMSDLADVDVNVGLIKGFTFNAQTGKAARKIEIRGSFT